MSYLRQGQEGCLEQAKLGVTAPGQWGALPHIFTLIPFQASWHEARWTDNVWVGTIRDLRIRKVHAWDLLLPSEPSLEQVGLIT